MATKLKLRDTGSRLVVSARVAEVLLALSQLDSLQSLSSYLDSLELEEEDHDVSDLRQWLPAFERFDTVLTELSPRLVGCLTVEAEAEQSGVNAKVVVCSILRFLRGLMKRGKEKRCFLSYNVSSLPS